MSKFSSFKATTTRQATREDFKVGTTLVCNTEGFEHVLIEQTYSDDPEMFTTRGGKVVDACEYHGYSVKIKE